MPEKPEYKINLIKPPIKRKEKFVGRRSPVTEITVKNGLSKTKIYRRDSVSQEQLDILRICHKFGLSVEQPIAYTVGKKGDMVFLNAGKELRPRLFKFTNLKSQEQILRQILDIILNMHILGIAHNHPHLGNIVMDSNGKITIIDFKNAQRKRLNWANSSNIINAFKADYLNLIRAVFDLGLTDLNAKDFFGFLISKYPSNSVVKQQIKQAIFDLIDNFYDRPEKYGP
jgi:predicted Ser/Thr protein kinase